jgi:hypothetical protein
MDGSSNTPLPNSEVPPAGGPPIIRFLWSRGRLQYRSLPNICGWAAADLATELKAEGGSPLLPGVTAVEIESPQVVMVDTATQRIVFDLRAGCSMTLNTVTADPMSDARAAREAQLCAAHLVDYHAREDQKKQAEVATRSRIPSMASTDQSDLLARSLARFANTQRLALEESLTGRL